MSVNLTIPANLQDEATFRDVVERAHELNAENAKGDAQIFTAALQKALQEAKLAATSPQTADAYNDVVTYLQFVAFSLLSDQERTNLVRHQLLLGLTTDVDLKTKLEILFLLIPDEMTARDELVRALLENDELLGTQPIVVQEGAGSLEPVISNWLIDFLRHTPEGRGVTALEIATYLNASDNVKRLSADDRSLLEQVLSLYVFLLNPPLTAVPTGHTIARAAAEATTAAPTDFRSALLQSLFEESQAEEAVYAEEQRLMSGGRYDRARIHEALWTGLSTGQRATVEAALFLMARSGELASFLARDAQAQEYVERQALPAIIADLKAQRASVTLEQVVNDFRRSPGRAVYLKLLIESILRSVHKGDDNASARAGVRLGDLLFRQGFSEAGAMAYYDVDTGQYRWSFTGLDSQGVPVMSQE